ncbi:fatty acid synthase-like isoform X2 [Sitophilus oryzae]|nr:fatty acid synthase-like isoform X2 [Sitophilus oryzae]
MVSDDNRRWEPGHPEIPHRTGKLFDIEKFDASFFGVHYRQANSLDPLSRILLETVMQSMFDAGLHPSDLEGTNTGVFVGVCFSESEKTWFCDKRTSQNFALTGCDRSMVSNRISYFLKLKGPSMTCDTACSSSLYALEHAYRAIRSGQCDQAIVGGANLCLNPIVSLQFARLGVLSTDGSCKAFDNAGNGYARSETISALILQKSKDAKRIYAHVLHAKTNCDGFKDSGITFPSRDMQIKLFREFYEEYDEVKPEDLSFLEAHGTGTKIGDPEELQAIETIFVKNRKTPLMIGSVKSNVGHTEPSSGMCSITKVIIGLETGIIPPNIRYNVPREGVKSLADGTIKVVSEKTPFKDDNGLVGINSFGFGGGNCHVLLKHNAKKKLNQGKPQDSIPRLVCVSGRTPEAVNVLLSDVISNKLDVEHIRLIQDIFRKNIEPHNYRGYVLASKSREIIRSCSYFDSRAPSLFICFGDISEATRKRAREFLEVPVFAATVQKIHEVLTSKRISIMDLLLKNDNQSVLDICLANVTLQLALANILRAIEIRPTRVFGVDRGFSLGTLVCGYFDGALTLSEVVELAFAIGSAAHAANKNGHTDIYSLLKTNEKIVKNLQETLAKIVPKPRKLSKNVIVDTESTELSAIYVSKSIGSLSVVENVRKLFKKSFVLLEIGNGKVGELLKSSKKKVSLVNTEGGLQEFLLSIGRLYELGFNPQLQHLYPKVQFPVSRGTPMISPAIKFKHEKDWHVSIYSCTDNAETEERSFKACLKHPDYAYIAGHTIDGRNLFPATGYLYIVWNTFADSQCLLVPDTKVVFENCRFVRALQMPANVQAKLDLTVTIQKESGKFEVAEGNATVVTGRIRLAVDDQDEVTPLPHPVGVPNSTVPYMTRKDVYKELRLRGYNYSGKFKGIQSCDISGQVATISWDGNWVAFMDNMLQMKILQEDTRLLYVPTTIARLTIDAKKHIEYSNTFGDTPNVPVYASKESGIIASGGIEIRGLIASSIARRKYLGSPVLEKHVFIPNIADLKLEQALRVNMQLILENAYSIHIKVAELVDEATPEENLILGDIAFDVLADQPLIQPNITVLSKTEIEVRNVTVEDKKLLTEVDCHLVIGSKLLERHTVLNVALGSIQESGFILSRESLDFDPSSCKSDETTLITVFSTEQEKLVFLRKVTEFKPPVVIKISSSDTEFSWLPKVRSVLEKEKDGNVLLYSLGETASGIMGLFNCIRREPGGLRSKLVFIPDTEVPEFDINLPFYESQLKKQLALNVYKNGQWGTYRHLLFDQSNIIQREHYYLNSLIRGDLKSLTWIEGPLSLENPTCKEPEETWVAVYYAALNFRDVMSATGRINVDTITRDRREQECVQGFEFSGRLLNGKRVMGMVTKGACASYVKAEKSLLFEIPESWTMQEAATVTVVYSTALYGLIVIARLKPTDSVLIHSGTGGVGQAAINLALGKGCTVYTTVGTPEKRELLKKLHPELTDDHIFNSRDTSFEQQVMRATKGRGVDIVLNSLAEEKLLASVRCLAQGGRFLEIGKFDLGNNNPLQLQLLKKNASFHGIMLDALITQRNMIKHTLVKLILDSLSKGLLKPLDATIFEKDQAEEAFRYMGTGKHTGKVLINIRQEEDLVVEPSRVPYPCVPRYYCNSDKSYIICGGLGGFGLELADWLVLRGCKKLVLTSRSGITTGYQGYRIGVWRSYGCTVRVATDDITTESGCIDLIKKANELGPVHAVFNLAVVLQDAILANQTEEMFKTSFAPKAGAAHHLDIVTRKYCPELRDFVMFSSVSCGRGNGGQTNYGMANSIMERICENRKAEGLPGLAIQWGAIGEVGLVADMQEEAIEIEIGGTLQQRVFSCMESLNLFLRQNEAPVVSSIVVAEKRSGVGVGDNIVSAVANILGIKDLKTISLQATLAEVGMDSMTAVEIKQTLEREFEVFLTPQDIKSMTFARLQEIQDERENESAGGKKERALNGFEMIIGHLSAEDPPEIPVLSLQGDPTEVPSSNPIILFPGIEGLVDVLKPLYPSLKGDLVGLQFCNSSQRDTIDGMADVCLESIEERLSPSEPFKIICYSFGGSVALQVAKKLEERGYRGTVVCIDSSPDYLTALSNLLEVGSDDKIQVSLLVHLMTLRIPFEVISPHLETMLKLPDFEARMALAEKIGSDQKEVSVENLKVFTVSIYKRLKALLTWQPNIQLKSKLVLLKPTLTSVVLKDADYGLSKLTETPVEVREFEGNHVSILENPGLAKAINEIFWGEEVDDSEESKEEEVTKEE